MEAFDGPDRVTFIRKNPFDVAAESVQSQIAPELPFDEIWTPEPEAHLVIPAMGIAPGPPHLVTGTWYTGKTLLLATMGLAVASGRALFGLWSVRRGRWVHFDHEMGRRHLKRYVQRLRAGTGIDPEELRDRTSLRILPRLNLRSDDAMERYTEILSGCVLATIDPLRAAAPGADENKSEFREHLDMLAIVSDRTGCAIVVLHHGGKPSAEQAVRRNTGRGTSAIDDAVQSKFVLSAEEKGAPMLVSHEKTRELTKPLDDFYLEIDNSMEGAVKLVHREPEELSQRMERKTQTREAEELERALEKAREAIRKVFEDRGGSIDGTRAEILSLVRGSRSITAQAFTEMKLTREIERHGRYLSGTFRLVSRVRRVRTAESP